MTRYVTPEQCQRDETAWQALVAGATTVRPLLDAYGHPAPAGAIECGECGGYGTVLSGDVNPCVPDDPCTCEECGGDGFTMPEND